MDRPPSDPQDLIFCIPIFNDWESAALLLARIGEVTRDQGWKASVVFVDDGSTEPWTNLSLEARGNLCEVEILSLRRNLGHQRAIAVGLTFIAEKRPCRAVVVMDGDGEDAPEDVSALWRRFQEGGQQRIVFAQRARRSEGLTFKIGYLLFKAVHWTFTGRRVEVGNFSIIPREQLERLIGVSELWNHYAASVFKARLKTDQVPLARGQRLRSGSKMNFVSLVMHGLSAISVFAEEFGVRLILATFALMGLTAVGLGTVIFTGILSNLHIPDWAVSTVGFLILALLNALMLSALFSFGLLQSRNGNAFLPLRDYQNFVLRVTSLDSPK